MNPASPSFGSTLLLRYAKIAVFVFALTATMVIGSFTYFRSLEIVAPLPNTVVQLPKNNETQEGRTDFGAVAPADFPTAIPLETGIMMSQSYSMDYPDQKQLTAVFTSKDEMKKNYDKYADVLKQDQWTISNTYEGERVSSLYATKEKNEINVTVSAGAVGGSEVSVSVLKK